MENVRLPGLSRDIFHPTRMWKYWPEFGRFASRCGQDFDPFMPREDQFQAFSNGTMHLYQDAVMRVPFEQRPATIDVLMNHVEMGLRFGYLWSEGFNIYSISSSVREALSRTTLEGVRLGDLRLPFDTLYLGFEDGSKIHFTQPGSNDVLEVDGAYVRDLPTRARDEGRRVFEIVLTTQNRRGQGSSLDRTTWPVLHEPHYTFPLGGSVDDTFEEALGFAIDAGNLPLEVDDEATDAFRKGVIAAQGEALAAGMDVRAPELTGSERRSQFLSENLGPARAGLALVLGALSALTVFEQRKTDMPLVWPESTPVDLLRKMTAKSTHKARRTAQADLKKRSFAPVRRIDLRKDPVQPGLSAETGGGAARAAHWRAGHFRRQRHGPGLTLSRLTWIFPQIIGGDKANPRLGRVYRIDESDPDEA